MITDKIENINIYSDIPNVVKDFILKLSKDAPLGRITLSDDIYVNIESYKTKCIEEAKFEAHERYIDIQILLDGTEDIYYTDKLKLTVREPYDDSKDIVFYAENPSGYPKVLLDGSNFAVLFPHEAHAPQVSADSNKTNVKKVVVKIKV